MGTLLHAVAHGLVADDTIMLANLTGGEGLEENTVYYVLAAGLTANDFAVSETSGGAALVFTTNITAGSIVRTDTYEAVADGVMDPPPALATPDPVVLTSLTVSGVSRLFVEVPSYTDAATRLRAVEVQLTHKYTASTPDFTSSQTLTLPIGTSTMSVPSLALTLYAARMRVIDVYGNTSSYSSTTELTTADGVDARGVIDGAITTSKLGTQAVTTDKIAAQAITADLLSATILLASLIRTANSGRRLELDVDGFRIYDTDDSLLVRMPTNGDPNFFKGQVTADSLISQTSASLRTAVSLEGSAVMTLQNGVAAPSTVPTLVASVDYLTKAASTGSIAAAGGIGYDSGAGTFWIACDPTVSPYYVAQEFNATTGALVRSISATGSTSTVTTTLGSTSHVSDTADAVSGSTNSHFAVPLTMPRDGTITKVSAYIAGYGGDASCRVGVWDDVSGAGNLLRESATFTATNRAFANGNSDHYNQSLTTGLAVTSGQTIYAGFRHTVAGDGIQFDKDDGAGKTTYSGDGTTADGTGWGTYDSAGKPNVYITYTYTVDTRLETAPCIGVATDGTYVYTLDTLGQVWKYDRTTLAYVANSGVQTAITGTKSKAGMFYDSTATELLITTTTGTGAGVFPKIVRVTPSTLAVSSTVYSAAAGPTFSGTTDTFRGGARLADPLNASAATYWIATTSAVYAYTFSGTTLTNTTSRDFGLATTVGDGLTYDGTQFRGWDTAAPTKVWKFTAWDWTTASAIYWVCYAWYDSAGTTHETVVSPRASLTLRRRERLQVTTATIPTGGADDPDKARIYMKPNATDPGAGAFKLQVTDALTARFLTTYDSAGAADGGGTAFPVGTPATLGDSGAHHVLKGTGAVSMVGTAFPASPATNDHFYRSDLGQDFYYDGTRWLSTVIHTVYLGSGAATTSYAATTTNVAWAPISLLGGSDAYLLSCESYLFVATGGTALGASHKWNVAVDKGQDSSATVTNIVSADLASGANGSRKVTTTINALLNNGTTHDGFRYGLTKTGTPGAVFTSVLIYYRVVAT